MGGGRTLSHSDLKKRNDTEEATLFSCSSCAPTLAASTIQLVPRKQCLSAQKCHQIAGKEVCCVVREEPYIQAVGGEVMINAELQLVG